MLNWEALEIIFLLVKEKSLVKRKKRIRKNLGRSHSVAPRIVGAPHGPLPRNGRVLQAVSLSPAQGSRLSSEFLL